MIDQHTYGLNRQDMSDVVQLIELRDEEYIEGIVRRGGGGSGQSTKMIATMKENWSGGIAECDIKSFDGVTVTDTGIDANVHDPLGVFALLETGASMYVTLQGGKYYAADNASCPEE